MNPLSLVTRLLAFGLAGVFPATALAHAFGEPVQLPMPYELYIWGATGALVLSFVFLARFGSGRASTTASLSLPSLLRSNRSVTNARLIGSAWWLAVMVFCVVAGVIGSRDSLRNLNMTLFWIIFALGGAYASMLVGDWYKSQNPWHLLLPRHWQGVIHYPRWLAYWPAYAQFVGLICIELFLHSNPQKLSSLLLGYAFINFTAMAFFGTRRWLQRGELFYSLFRMFAWCSPLYKSRSLTGQPRWRLVVPFGQLRRAKLWHASQWMFVFFLLSSTAFDGLRETSVYFNVFWQDPLGLITGVFGEHPMKIYPTVRPWFILYELVLLVISPLFYMGLFLLFVWLGRLLTGAAQPMRYLLQKYLPSLIPIAVVYHVTHYYTLLLSQGVKVRGLVSDPFGWGWNIFGTAITGRLPWLPDMAYIWLSQVVLILVGHVAAVWLAHHEALKLERSPRLALLSQLPMLVLMVIFTAVGLWVLAQPLKG